MPPGKVGMEGTSYTECSAKSSATKMCRKLVSYDREWHDGVRARFRAVCEPFEGGPCGIGVQVQHVWVGLDHLEVECHDPVEQGSRLFRVASYFWTVAQLLTDGFPG